MPTLPRHHAPAPGHAIDRPTPPAQRRPPRVPRSILATSRGMLAASLGALSASFSALSLLACAHAPQAKTPTEEQAPSSGGAYVAATEVIENEPRPPKGAQHSATPAALAKLTALAAREKTEVDLSLDAEGRITKISVEHDHNAAWPAAVREAAQRALGGQAATGYESEHYAKHGAVFEAEYKNAAGEECEVALLESGEELYRECELDVSKLPAPIRQDIEGRYPGASIDEVEERVWHSNKAHPSRRQWRIDVKQGKQEFYLHYSPSGALQSVSHELEAEIKLRQ